MNRIIHCTLIAAATLVLGNNPTQGQKPYGNFEEYELDLLKRPNLVWESEQQILFHEGLVQLWARALERDEAQLTRLVVDSLAIAHTRGVPDTLTLKPTLLELASRDNLDPQIAAAIANTLVTFEAKDQGELLATLSEDYGPLVAGIVEPALANWQVDTLKSRWLERLEDGVAGETAISFAIKGLAAIGCDEAIEPIQAVVLDEKLSPSIRLVAAQQLGALEQTGLNPLAQRVVSLNADSTFHRLLAIEILGQHSSDAAIEFFTNCLTIDSNAVQAEAVRNLYRIKPSLVEQLYQQLRQSKDANVRGHLINALADSRSAERMVELCFFLNDVNPTLRRDAASHLIELAEVPDLKSTIIDSVVQIQAKEQWQGCEQASFVLGTLKHLPSGSRMVELLGHPRGDVKVAAAWGLNELRMPEHLPAMLEHAQSIWDGFQSGQLNAMMRGITLHQALLFNAFGDQLYAPAEPLLMAYVPKNFNIGVDARVAAVWALGMIHEDDPVESLVADLVARMEDNGQFPEIEDVRNMSGVSLGRMRAESALDSIERFAGEGLTGSQWALQRMTGKEPAKPRPNRVLIDDWFLAPAPGSAP
ncbi:MAG: HEAT repeat domain-containing protein [Rubripirellula sp.]|nr:HEAT repeat domain-containing protein [Rubripirellula sp.]